MMSAIPIQDVSEDELQAAIDAKRAANLRSPGKRGPRQRATDAATRRAIRMSYAYDEAATIGSLVSDYGISRRTIDKILAGDD